MNDKMFTDFIKRSIDNAIEQIVDEEFEAVTERIEKRKAEVIAGIILHVQRSMTMQTIGQELTIKVLLPK